MQPFVPRCGRPNCSICAPTPLNAQNTRRGDYDRWFIEHLFVWSQPKAIVGQFLATFQEFPPRQKPGSFSVDQALEKTMNQKGSN